MDRFRRDITVCDIGGTNARFCLAEIAGGKVIGLGPPVTLLTRDYASLASSWQHFGRTIGRDLPRAGAIAIACPITGETLRLTNNPWIIRRASLAQELGLDALTLINDFGAVAQAVTQLPSEHFLHLAGPDVPLPAEGVITVIGPGTGLGAAQILRRAGQTQVIECEGGHIGYAPLDPLEDAMLAQLRQRYGRVSAERVVSGPGLANIYQALAAIEGRAVQAADDASLWRAAIEGSDDLATAALARFCLSFGAVAGDLALAQGANGVVIAGGIAPRIVDILRNSGFAARFAAKGRFQRMMAGIPIKMITHPQPGLFGAAAAFAAAH